MSGKTVNSRRRSAPCRSTCVRTCWCPAPTWSTWSGRGARRRGFMPCRSPVPSSPSVWCCCRATEGQSGWLVTPACPGWWDMAAACLWSRWSCHRRCEGGATAGLWWRRPSAMPDAEGSDACAWPHTTSSTSMPTLATCSPHRCRTPAPWRRLFRWRCFWDSPGCPVRRRERRRKHWAMGVVKFYKRIETHKLLHLHLQSHLHHLLTLSPLLFHLRSSLLHHLLTPPSLPPLHLHLRGSWLYRLWLKLPTETPKELPSIGCTKTFDELVLSHVGMNWLTKPYLKNETHAHKWTINALSVWKWGNWVWNFSERERNILLNQRKT